METHVKLVDWRVRCARRLGLEAKELAVALQNKVPGRQTNNKHTHSGQVQGHEHEQGEPQINNTYTT